ncbi:MAG: DUF1292 domain-containing protein [Bacilli bacterium]|nr:DUF1292 domain-containing protein [Bacilli bacterium]
MDLDFENDKIQLEKDGKTVDCDVLFTFDSEDTLKSYVGYTDHSIASNGRKNVYVSSFQPFGARLVLEDITDEAELQMISEVLMKFDEETE